jgi:two-component system phosphate regulon response regulator OmpR
MQVFHDVRYNALAERRSCAMPHILLVDDDERLRDLLRRYLMSHGFKVSLAADGQQALALKQQNSYDLMILDIMMPGQDGFSVCRYLRACGDDIPIVVLTARTEDSHCIMGLDVGADDYLGKPFNPRELLARIQAVLRRSQPMAHPAAPSTPTSIIAFGPYQLNLSSRRLTRHGERLALSSSEFALLKVFVRHPHTPLSRERLMQLVRRRSHDASDRSLDVQISRLRKRLEPQPSKPIYIQTVWAVGYVFVPDAQP